MVIVEHDSPLFVDNDHPRRSSTPVRSHDLRRSRGSFALAERDLQAVALRHHLKFVGRIGVVAFKRRLNRDKLNIFVIAKFCFERFKCWKTGAVTAWAPRLKEVQISDFAFNVCYVKRRFPVR